MSSFTVMEPVAESPAPFVAVHVYTWPAAVVLCVSDVASQPDFVDTPDSASVTVNDTATSPVNQPLLPV